MKELTKAEDQVMQILLRVLVSARISTHRVQYRILQSLPQKNKFKQSKLLGLFKDTCYNRLLLCFYSLKPDTGVRCGATGFALPDWRPDKLSDVIAVISCLKL